MNTMKFFGKKATLDEYFKDEYEVVFKNEDDVNDY